MLNNIKLKIKKYLLSGYGSNDSFMWNASMWAYKKFLIIHPNSFIIWMQFGNSARDSGLYDEAAIAYTKAMSINGQNSDVFLQLAKLAQKRGDVRDEFTTYLKAKDNNCINPEMEQELNKLNFTSARKSFIDQRGDEKKDTSIKNIKQIEFEKYSLIFKDVNLFVELGLVANAEQHYKHYGFKQGRDILASLHESPPDKAIIICPSMWKRCGIGEHSRYIALSLEKSGLKVEKIRTTQQLLELDPNTLQNSVVILNHGPELFDGHNADLSEGENSVRLISNLRYAFYHFGARPIVFMHSMHDRDNDVFFSRQQLLLEMPVPIATTISEAAHVFNIAHVEHGMQPLSKPYNNSTPVGTIDRPTVGFFGFYGLGAKNYDALLNTLQRIKGKLVGSVAVSKQDLPHLRKMLDERAIEENLGTGWVEDDELAERLSVADFHYLPQFDYDLWNNSGTARFVMNFGRPLIVHPYRPFLDLSPYAIFADEHDLPAVFSHLRTPAAHIEASQRAVQYAEDKPMTKEMVNLAFNLPAIQTESSLRQINPTELTCLTELLQCSAPIFAARMKYFFEADVRIEPTNPLSLDRKDQILKISKSHPEISQYEFAPLPKILYWREHYELRHLYRQNAYECFVHVTRSLLKREPGLHDEVLVKQLLGLDITDISLFISPLDFLKLVAGILGLDRAVSFSRPVQIYLDFEPLTRANLLEPTVVNRVTHDFETMLSHIQDFNSTPSQIFGSINDCNIFACLILPPKIGAFRIARALNLSNDLEMAIENIMHLDIDIYRRFMSINNIIREQDKDLLKIMLLDWPIIGDAMISRLEYHANEFALFTGIELVFQAYRSLLKRDPTAFELMNMEMIISRQGRIQMLRYLSQSSAACATIIDIDLFDDSDLDRTADLIRPLIERFRSPIAGGWDLRNQYLVERRNSSRLLLRIKKLKEDDYFRFGYNILSDKQVMANIG